ncbi:type IV secretory system conjugative DNA transfer family protein [Campylobacter jejuni]|nr:type IV secretory system conjugative DNA transfer family protein [Campylobacter jejuni]
MKNEINKKRLIIFIILMFIVSIIIYFLAVKVLFKPVGIKPTILVGIQIIKSLGNPALKLKAYLPLILGLSPYIFMIFYFLLNKSGNEDYGNARFAKKSDFEKMGIENKNGLILGYQKDLNKINYIKVSKPLSCLMVAPPGSGKSAAIAITNLLQIKNSVLVTDIKSELIDKTAKVREKELKNKILRFDPLSNKNTLFYNPFAKENIKDLDFSQLQNYIQRIASIIFQTEKSEHWDKMSKALFEFLALYFIITDGETNLYNLSQAPKMSFLKEFQKYAHLAIENGVDFQSAKKWEEMVYNENGDKNLEVNEFKIFLQMVENSKDILNLNSYIKNYARQFSSTPDNEFGSIKSTYDSFMKIFSNSKVANATNKNNFAYEDMRKEKISVYVAVKTEDIDFLSPLLRIFIEGFFIKMMSGEENSDPDKFIYCILDEFVRFGKMPFLLEAPALCRSYGLIPLYITQSYQQIKKCYGEDELGILRSNVGYQVIYRMNTEEDAKRVSEIIGDYTRKKSNISKGNFDLIKSNISTSYEGYKLVPSQKILNMPEEECLILVTGFLSNPIKAYKAYYFKNKDLLSLMNKHKLEDEDIELTEEQFKDLPKKDQKEYKKSLQIFREYAIKQKESDDKVKLKLEEVNIKKDELHKLKIARLKQQLKYG